MHCEMRGRRVAEIACGGLEKFVDEISQATLHDFDNELLGMDEGAATVGRREFQVGTRFVAAELRLRIQPHYELPIKAACIGHPDERKARAGLVICMALFEEGRAGAAHCLPPEVVRGLWGVRGYVEECNSC